MEGLLIGEVFFAWVLPQETSPAAVDKHRDREIAPTEQRSEEWRSARFAFSRQPSAKSRDSEIAPTEDKN